MRENLKCNYSKHAMPGLFLAGMSGTTSGTLMIGVTLHVLMILLHLSGYRGGGAVSINRSARQ